MYYLIDEVLQKCNKCDIYSDDRQYVIVLTSDQWKDENEGFDMGIDLELDTEEIHTTKVYVNYDSLTGTFCIPDRSDFSNEDKKFAFALDEKGIIFIDNSGVVENMIENIRKTRKWKLPSLERFIYDFFDQIIKDDNRMMEKYERVLDDMEQEVMGKDSQTASLRVNEIRGDIRDIRIHYEQLLDFMQILEENDNNFFKHENIRYFRLFSNRIERLRDSSSSLRDYTVQLQDLYQTHLDIKQNRIMTILTVVTVIFMPLHLIAGWYGMNFKNMPELNSDWGYPIVIFVCIAIVVISLIFFKKKKWL